VDCESDACISIGIVHRIWYYLYLPVELGAGATRECRGRVPGVCNRRGGGGGLVYWEDMAYHGHSLQGGLGLGSMVVVSLAAYLASHVDYLAFMNKAHASLFCAVRPLVCPSALWWLDLPIVATVHATWDTLCGELDGEDESGLDHLRLTLGEHVQSATDLALARAGAQGALIHALWRSLELSLRAEGSLATGAQLTSCGVWRFRGRLGHPATHLP
jgi:hypothetical protein